jgi:SET family sugar efflux transporter-like MFS transporter
MTPVRHVLRHQTLRLIVVALLLLGALNASVYPYQSVIAIERIGISRQAFSLMLAMASVIAVTSSVLLGVLGDQFGHRRVIALGTAFCSTLGIALILASPGVGTLILCQGVLLPLASSMYGQLFALARLASPDEGHQRDAILGTIRSAMSFTFLAMLMFWTFAFRYGLSEMAVYVSGGVASLGLLTLVFLGWPRDGQTPWADPRSGMRLRDALAEIAKPNVAVRVFLIGALASAGNLYMVLISLVFDASPVRGPADVALYVGMVAGWEVPAMLILPRFARLVPRSTLMAGGAVLYGLHLMALPILSDTAFLWVMPFFGGVGGAVIITTPIAYYQDLMRARPGTAAAMLAVHKLVADVLTAAVFAATASVGGFEVVAVSGVLISLMGALGVYWADRLHWFPARA